MAYLHWLPSGYESRGRVERDDATVPKLRQAAYPSRTVQVRLG